MNRATRSRRRAGVPLAALAVAVLAGVGRDDFATGGELPTRIPAGANAEGDGIVAGRGPVRVDAYIDFLCPFCRRFEQAAGPILGEIVAEDLISLVYHPMGFLDELSTTRYSSRAAAASGCAADGERFVQYAHELFAHQPPEGGPGLSDDELIQLGEIAGLPEPDFARCIRNATYLPWAQYVTERALTQGVAATPTVFVQGVPVPANPQTIVAAVAAAASAP
ncbi:MAG: Protein-disulfide isomerase-like protein [Streptosporangiaceae bacterium]|jgi:protein-disulfide isomerase|nr:Protein-disulfide isomerase-like protein [Streptosporangiaceae bacterium]